MARRQINRLAPIALKALAPGRHADGGGLYLYVSDAGARSWVFRWKVGRRRREMGLGRAVDTVGLAEARRAAAECRARVAAGGDPIVERDAQEAKERASVRHTFRTITETFLLAKAAGWSNPKHRDQWKNTLEQYAFPKLGGMVVGAIDTADVLGVLTPIWNTRNETASRVRGRVEAVLSYATALKYRIGDNPARWRGHMDQLLPKPSKVKKVRHHPALPYAKIHAFMEELRLLDGHAPRALEFAILTALRTGEVLGAQWREIDLQQRLWKIPAQRMKAKRPHSVPLSAKAVAVLKRMEGLSKQWVFPTTQTADNPLSNNALLAVLHRMGRNEIVTHGFRSTFRDWAAECTNFPTIVAKAAMAHTIRDKSEAAYRRGELLEKRSALMAAWGKYCDTAPAMSAEVLSMANRKRS